MNSSRYACCLALVALSSLVTAPYIARAEDVPPPDPTRILDYAQIEAGADGVVYLLTGRWILRWNSAQRDYLAPIQFPQAPFAFTYHPGHRRLYAIDLDGVIMAVDLDAASPTPVPFADTGGPWRTWQLLFPIDNDLLVSQGQPGGRQLLLDRNGQPLTLQDDCCFSMGKPFSFHPATSRLYIHGSRLGFREYYGNGAFGEIIPFSGQSFEAVGISPDGDLVVNLLGTLFSTKQLSWVGELGNSIEAAWWSGPHLHTIKVRDRGNPPTAATRVQRWSNQQHLERETSLLGHFVTAVPVPEGSVIVTLVPPHAGGYHRGVPRFYLVGSDLEVLFASPFSRETSKTFQAVPTGPSTAQLSWDEQQAEEANLDLEWLDPVTSHWQKFSQVALSGSYTVEGLAAGRHHDFRLSSPQKFQLDPVPGTTVEHSVTVSWNIDKPSRIMLDEWSDSEGDWVQILAAGIFDSVYSHSLGVRPALSPLRFRLRYEDMQLGPTSITPTVISSVDGTTRNIQLTWGDTAGLASGWFIMTELDDRWTESATLPRETTSCQMTIEGQDAPPPLPRIQVWPIASLIVRESPYPLVYRVKSRGTKPESTNGPVVIYQRNQPDAKFVEWGQWPIGPWGSTFLIEKTVTKWVPDYQINQIIEGQPRVYASAWVQSSQTPTSLPPPTGLSASTDDERRVELRWNPVDGAQHYQVFYRMGWPLQEARKVSEPEPIKWPWYHHYSVHPTWAPFFYAVRAFDGSHYGPLSNWVEGALLASTEPPKSLSVAEAFGIDPADTAYLGRYLNLYGKNGVWTLEVPRAKEVSLDRLRFEWSTNLVDWHTSSITYPFTEDQGERWRDTYQVYTLEHRRIFIRFPELQQ